MPPPLHTHAQHTAPTHARHSEHSEFSREGASQQVVRSCLRWLLAFLTLGGGGLSQTYGPGWGAGGIKGLLGESVFGNG